MPILLNESAQGALDSGNVNKQANTPASIMNEEPFLADLGEKHLTSDESKHERRRSRLLRIVTIIAMDP